VNIEFKGKHSRRYILEKWLPWYSVFAK